MLIGSLILTAVLTAIACVAYSFRATWAVLTALAVFLLLACGGQGTLLLPIVLGLGIIAAVCRANKVSTKGFAVSCAGVTAALLALAVVVFIPKHREHLRLLREYPFVNVDQRLAYETQGIGSGPAATAVSALAETAARPAAASDSTAINSAFWSNDREGGRREVRSRYRQHALLSLARAHRGFVSDFIGAEGFGVIRMFRVPADREHIELPQPPPLTLPDPPPPVSAGSDDGALGVANDAGHAARDAAVASVSLPDESSLASTHLQGLVEFANPEGFGYVESRQRVLGFQSHGFRAIPTVADAMGETSPWRIVSLELVSLLKHEPPAVYVSKHLPRMAELSDAPTRPLDEFESAAIAKLRAGDELVVDSTAEQIRMVGPLRAYQECRNCHQVDEVTLLGAFTYRLRPAGAPARKPAAGSSKPTL